MQNSWLLMASDSEEINFSKGKHREEYQFWYDFLYDVMI